MVSCITDSIEHYLLQLLQRGSTIELQRVELAQRFQCAPSQINYVLETRFTQARGFSVESRRGGGGYIRVMRLPDEGLSWLDFAAEIDQQTAEHHLDRLRQAGCLTSRETAALRAVVSRDVLRLPLPLRDRLRAAVLRAGLRAILEDGLGGEGEGNDVPTVRAKARPISRQPHG